MVKSRNLLNKRWKLVTLYVVISISVFGGLFYWVTWRGTTDHIVSVADQFKVPEAWKLAQTSTKPPQSICIAQKCPNLSRIWTTPAAITQESLLSIVSKSGWAEVTVEDGCESAKKTYGDHVCTLRGHVDGYDIVVRVTENNQSFNKPTVSLHME